MHRTRVCQQAESSIDSCARFAMSALLRGRASTGTVRTSTSHERSAATVGYLNGPRHANIYSLGILRNVAPELDAKPPRLGPATTQLQTRRGTFKVRDVSATSSEEPVSMSDPVIFMGSGGWPQLCA